MEMPGRFVCNICGAENKSALDPNNREEATCLCCRSSMRFRAIVLALSRALFGMDLSLRQFPVLKSIRGLGISDSEIYSGRLATRFSYTNTFHDREPSFDLTQPGEEEFGKYDFVICSDVLEHIPYPVESGFRTLARLLAPHGVLILTAPYTLESATEEHFPGLRRTALVEIDGRSVLVSRSADGRYEVFDDLVFHGGQGATLERRVFSEADLRAGLAAAGLTSVRFEVTGSRQFGVDFSYPWSLPIIAGQAPFSLRTSGIRELVEQLVKERDLLKAVKRSRWLRVGRWLGQGPRLR